MLLALLFCLTSAIKTISGNNAPVRTSVMNLTQSTSALLLSYAAYCGTNVNANFDCYWCQQFTGGTFQFVGTFGKGNSSSFGYVGYDFVNSRTYVVWRGTDDLAGWIADADFVQTPLTFAPASANANVHEGFLNAFNATASSVASLVSAAQTACTTCTTLVVTGHSLGGALATLSAAYIATQSNYGFASVQLLTFGSPRVGDPAFATWFASLNVAVQRMTWHRDLAPRVPWQNMLGLHYHHVAVELFYNGTGYRFCDNTGEDKTCSDQYIVLNIFDHANYMNIDVLAGIPFGCLYTDPMLSIDKLSVLQTADY